LVFYLFFCLLKKSGLIQSSGNTAAHRKLTPCALHA